MSGEAVLFFQHTYCGSAPRDPIRNHYDVNHYRCARTYDFAAAAIYSTPAVTSTITFPGIDLEEEEIYTHTQKPSHPHCRRTSRIMDALPVTNQTAGEPESAQNHVLETGAGMTQVGNSVC
jgi:hypothetical protein